nr:hypothetical protein [Kofleriaceae bacterium]
MPDVLFDVRLTSLACAVAACAVAACEPAPKPALAPLTGSAVAPPPDTRTCITRSDAPYPPSADSVAIAGDQVSLCFGSGAERSCWRADTSTKVFTPLAVTAPVPPPPAASAALRADGMIEVCGAGHARCTAIANPGAVAAPQWVSVSPDLATLAIPDDHATLRTYDVATGRLRATIHGWPDSPMAGDAFNYPPTFAAPGLMIVWYAWTPVSEQGRIYDLAGTPIAIVGKHFDAIDPDKNAWRVHDAEWVIKSEGDDIMTVDVAHPGVSASYDLHALFALPRPPADADAGYLEVLAIAGTAKRLVVVTGENPTTIGVLDRETRKLDKLEPPRCPPPPPR